MQHIRAWIIAATGLVCTTSCTSNDDSVAVQVPSEKTVLDLDDVKTNPAAYEWFDFRPNLEKLILSGAAETEHVAILWYTIADGSVGLHYHSKTESVYVIDGTQTDAKGVYPTGTVYFNPPGSGHQIMDSTGFFILAYASPPDFASTDLIQEYTPVRIDTAGADLMSAYAFEQKAEGIRTFSVPLNSAGGMSAEFIEVTSPADRHEYVGNYLLVLGGACDIDGATRGTQTLVVAKTVEPESFDVSAPSGATCRGMGVSFLR
jgi:ChrR Cupin-like domain